MNIPTEKKGRTYLKRVIIILIVLGTLGYGGFYVWQQYQKVETTSRFDGQVACLPSSVSAEPPDKATCVKGLKNSDGLYYVVQGVPQASLKLEETIAIKGTLDPVTNETDGKYLTVGVITGELMTPRR